MIKAVLRINNKLGLHARASAKLTKLASTFASDVHLSRNGRRVNAKSIMGVMMLAAEAGASVELRAEGEDAEQALAELVALVERGFDEDDEGRPVKPEGETDG